MHITIGKANLVKRICRIIIPAALGGTFMLLVIPMTPPPAPMAVMPANHAFDVEPIQYLNFDMLTSRKGNPFDFQDNILKKRSFIVPEKPKPRIQRSKPVVQAKPEPNIRGLRLLATSPDGSASQAIIEDTSSRTGLLTVTIGNQINGNTVTQIFDTGITLTLGEKHKDLLWENPWQKEFDNLIRKSLGPNGLKKENQ
jgi:hypothetical protein